MSSAEASPTRGITGWWKNLKKHSNLSNESIESSNNKIDDFLKRPSNFKSRSLTAVKGNMSNSNSSNPNSNSKEDLIRQQRDEFMAAQNKFGVGNEVFGVSLEQSIKVAESLISVPSDDPDEFIKYGKIPLLVGKCGSFLKERGLKVEGIYRVAGASRRVKELQFIFSTPPEYGRKLNWEGYTVHDAASLFRRFLNNLPEPLVPLDSYEDFRLPVKTRPRIINHIKARNETIEKRIRSLQLQPTDQANTEPEVEEKSEQQKQKDARKQKRIAKDLRNALKEYRVLIDRLPEAQKHLLYYLLDMLTMFSEHSKENLMTARNLAAIFQPSILSHPSHDLTPDEYALSQAVVEVLIEYSKRLLPDVKKFATDSKRSSIVKTSEPESNRGSSANLLAVRNSAKGSRPHSRSLSSANGAPHSISVNVNDYEETEDRPDDNESSEDDDAEDDSEFLTISHDKQRLETPPSITKSTSIDGKQIKLATSPPQPQQRVSSKSSSYRPVSMFPGGLSTYTDEEERRSRSTEQGADDFLNPETGSNKTGSWFRRLRSSSRSNEKQ